MEVPSVSSVLVRRALLQVKNNVSETLYWLIRRRLLALMAPLVSCEQTRDALQPETEPGRRDAPGSEWSAFDWTAVYATVALVLVDHRRDRRHLRRQLAILRHARREQRWHRLVGSVAGVAAGRAQ